jgi:hypothetical protein
VSERVREGVRERERTKDWICIRSTREKGMELTRSKAKRDGVVK